MKKLLLETSFSKIYMIGMILITLLILGGYFSYAMFTVSKEKSNAISIITGNLTYKLEVDGKEDNTLTVASGEDKTFIVTLTNPNDRIARFNFYYTANIRGGVVIGYIVDNDFDIPMPLVGANLEANSSKTYKIRITNTSSNSITINLGVGVGLDYNDLTIPSNGHLFEEIKLTGPVSDVILDNIGPNGGTFDDDVDTFITGSDPNNYIWYSGKLWRAVSVNNEAKTTKIVTEWNISAIPYSSGNTAFKDSYMEDWLNDTSVDGFLGNLRDYENFIVTDSIFDATKDTSDLESVERPNGTTTVTDAVGLLNMYEYQSSYYGTTYSNGYLNNGLYFWTLTPYNSSNVWRIGTDGSASYFSSSEIGGIRPTINLKSSVKVVDGEGTINNPYRLEGDNDKDLNGTLLNTRYSGEYIRFGNDENSLYRIVSHENGIGTKITSAEPLKNSGEFIESAFGTSIKFSKTNTISTFFNNNYLTNYIDNDYASMIEDDTVWYYGTVANGASYKLAKYKTVAGTTLTASRTTTKIGLLRIGELMAGQFDRSTNNVTYWTLTPYSTIYVRFVGNAGGNNNASSPKLTYGVRPALNLKENVIITSGEGTKEKPFVLAFA